MGKFPLIHSLGVGSSIFSQNSYRFFILILNKKYFFKIKKYFKKYKNNFLIKEHNSIILKNIKKHFLLYLNLLNFKNTTF